MRYRKNIGLRPLLRKQKPATTSFLERMQAIAGRGLRDLADYGVDVPLDNAAKCFATFDLGLDSSQIDPKRLPGDLYDGIPNWRLDPIQSKDASQTLRADGRHLDRSTILHGFDQRDQTPIHKIKVIDWRIGIMQHTPLLQINPLKVGS